MERLIALSLGILLLAGCTEEGRREQTAAINSNLPEGCEMTDAGRYMNIEVLVVTCEGRSASTVNMAWRAGKVQHRAATVTVEDE